MDSETTIESIALNVLDSSLRQMIGAARSINADKLSMTIGDEEIYLVLSLNSELTQKIKEAIGDSDDSDF